MRIRMLEGAAHLDVPRFDPVSPRAVTETGARAFDFANSARDRTRMEGDELTYDDLLQGPVSGRIEAVGLFAGAADPLARLTGTVRVDDLPAGAVSSGEAFWAGLLEGRTDPSLRRTPQDDVFLDRTISAGAAPSHEGGTRAGAGTTCAGRTAPASSCSPGRRPRPDP